MEPATVEPLTEAQLNGEENDFDDGNDTIEDDNLENKRDEAIRKAVAELELGIQQFKKQLNSELTKDIKDPADLRPMMTFHSVFLAALSYWIGLLDSSPVAPPSLKPSLQKGFKSLTSAIEKVAQANLPMSRILVYQAINSFCTQSPYDFGPVENNEDE